VIPRSSKVAHQIANFGAIHFKMTDADVETITSKFDDGTLLFRAPEENPYNLFV
jgi:diketogulonate reductase-like aldo/keto reductase